MNIGLDWGHPLAGPPDNAFPSIPARRNLGMALQHLGRCLSAAVALYLGLAGTAHAAEGAANIAGTYEGTLTHTDPAGSPTLRIRLTMFADGNFLETHLAY